MFKLTFPWAQHSEEQRMCGYLKDLTLSWSRTTAYNRGLWLYWTQRSPVKNLDGQQKSISSPLVFKIPAKDKTNESFDAREKQGGDYRASTPRKSATPSTKSGSTSRPVEPQKLKANPINRSPRKIFQQPPLYPADFWRARSKCTSKRVRLNSQQRQPLRQCVGNLHHLAIS